MLKPKFVGVAGGTGAGKSSLCQSLIDSYPDDIGLIQLDDYYKPAELVPKMHGFDVWDHPDSLYLDRFENDLKHLGRGGSVTVMTKNSRINPEYNKTQEKIAIEIKPKRLMLVDGFLVLHKKEIREQLAMSVWLDADTQIRLKRRVHFQESDYYVKVLAGLHSKYAEPTKLYADLIIDVDKCGQQKTYDIVESICCELLEQE